MEGTSMNGSMCSEVSDNADKQYQVLTPVQLPMNEDDDVTSLKQVYVSYGQTIQINPDNAEDIFNSLPPSTLEVDSNETACVDVLIKMFHDLPRDIFVNQLLRDLYSCESSLEHMRDQLFDRVKELHDFPFGTQCSLKKRVQTRHGDPVAVKLARDVHTVLSVLEGGEVSDLRDLVSSSRQRMQRSQSISYSSYRREENPQDQCKCKAVVKELHDSVSGLAGDVLTLKQRLNEVERLREQQMKSIETAMLDVSQLIKTLSEAVSKGVAETKLGLQRIQTECSNSIVRLKNEMKVIRQDMSECTDIVTTCKAASDIPVTTRCSKVDEGRSKTNGTKNSPQRKRDDKQSSNDDATITEVPSTPSASDARASNQSPIVTDVQVLESYSQVVKQAKQPPPSSNSTDSTRARVTDSTRAVNSSTNNNNRSSLIQRSQTAASNSTAQESRPIPVRVTDPAPADTSSMHNNVDTLEDDVLFKDSSKRRSKRYFLGGFKTVGHTG